MRLFQHSTGEIACRVLCFLSLWLLPCLGQSSPQSLEDMELAHRKLVEMIQRETDPAKTRQLSQARQLLEMILANAKKQLIPPTIRQPTLEPKKPAREPTPPAEAIEPTPPPLPVEPAPEPAPPEPSPPLEPSPPPLKESAEQNSQETVTPPKDLPPPSMPRIPPWLFDSSLVLALGYHENLLHSANVDRDSASFLAEAEFSLLNTERESDRFLGFGRLSRTHFLEADDVRDEDLILLLGRWDHKIGDAFWLGLQTDFLRTHQPLDDPNILQPNEAGVPLILQQWSLGPALTWEPSEGQSFSLEPRFRREDIGEIAGEDYGNSQWLMAMEYRGEWAQRHLVRLRYEWSERNYDHREARLGNGAILPGSELEVETRTLDASYRHAWRWDNGQVRWTNGVRFHRENDREGGYDDMSRLDLYTRLDGKLRRRFEWNGEVGFNQYDYRSRLVSPTSSKTRERESWYLRFQAGWRLQKSTQWWLRYEQRDNSGNRDIDRYGYRELSSGIQVEF